MLIAVLSKVYKDARSGPTINPTGGFVNPVNNAPTGRFKADIADTTSTTTTAATSRQTSTFTTKVNSRVISASIPNVVIKDLSEPVLISFFHLLEVFLFHIFNLHLPLHNPLADCTVGRKYITMHSLSSSSSSSSSLLSIMTLWDQ